MRVKPDRSETFLGGIPWRHSDALSPLASLQGYRVKVPRHEAVSRQGRCSSPHFRVSERIRMKYYLQV